MDDILSYHQHGNSCHPHMHPLSSIEGLYRSSTPWPGVELPCSFKASHLFERFPSYPQSCPYPPSMLIYDFFPMAEEIPFSAQSITIIFASSKCLFPFSR